MLKMGFKLKCLRMHRGLSQKDLAKLSGVGEKTISSFETEQRTESLKVSQLEALVGALDTTVVDFLAWNPDAGLAPQQVEREIAANLPAVVPLEPRRRPVDPLRGFRRDDDDGARRQSPLAHAV